MVTFRQKGDFSKATRFLERVKEAVGLGLLDKYGQKGVAALSAATPVDSGETAASWDYEIVNKKGSARITFTNSHIVKGVPIAIILQYGHGHDAVEYRGHGNARGASDTRADRS